MLFSVGESDGAGAVVVVVVVVVLDGAGDSPPPQAVNAPAEMAAAMPMVAATRRVYLRFFMVQSCLCCWGNAENLCELNSIVQKCPGSRRNVVCGRPGWDSETHC
jgi:hypothetical protein